MGNGGAKPRERNLGDQLRCCKCNKVLPPCYEFSDFVQDIVIGRLVYIFNGGEYYRPVDRLNYECKECFYKPIRDQEQMRAEERKREEQRMREEARREEERREEERREAERRKEEEIRKKAEEKKRKELNQKLKESQQHAREQHEREMSKIVSEEYTNKQHVLKSHLDEFEIKQGYDSERDELLETLSLKCGVPISKLSLAQLNADDLVNILSALDKLLFDEWIRTPPTVSTLQHAQLFITELCALSVEILEGFSLMNSSYDVQSVVGSISQSACNAFESFLFTQALYLNLMHFFRDHESSKSDASLIAERWAEDDLSIESLFLIEFLGNLMSSLQKTVDRATVFILNMEIQCLKHLLLIVTHLNDKENHSACTEILLKLVETNQWTPAEALALLKELSEMYEDASVIIRMLMLVHVYDISPDWKDDCGISLFQLLRSVHPHTFQQDFQKTLKEQDASSLDSALEQMKSSSTLNDCHIDLIKEITRSVLQYAEDPPNKELFWKESFKWKHQDANEIKNSLFQLCKAVYDTRGWWPTVQQMLRWCVLVLTEKSGAPQLVGVEGDSCVTVMFAATKVCMGHKVDVVLSTEDESYKETQEWAQFYKYLGISVNTNKKQSQQDVYESDILYGSMKDLISDYLQDGFEVMKTGIPHPERGYIIDKRSLSAFHNLELSQLNENSHLEIAAATLEGLMSMFGNKNMELGHMFLKALFQVLFKNLNKRTVTVNRIISISNKCTGQPLSPDKVYILTLLENLLEVFTRATQSDTNREGFPEEDELILEILFDCVVQFQTSKEQVKELFHMVSKLVAQQLWCPEEALNLLFSLTDHHLEENYTSIKKILYLMETYQVSFEWTDKKKQSIIELSNSLKTEDLIPHLEKSFGENKEKSIDCLFEEMRQMEGIDEQTFEKSYSIVKVVAQRIESGEIKNHKNINHARNLSQSTKTEDLQDILAVLCNAVHLCRADQKWWPRKNQMISWCLLALSDTGKLLEMGTGEGKSCVIAMFTVLRVLKGEKVDVVSSSSVLCERDAEEWKDFYSHFGITVDTNTNKTEDESRKQCYQKDVIYGTIEAFAADHLRQIFEMKDVRADRCYQCIIIDEVDSLLLDQGVQLTYLSSPMVSMQHLNTILAMIWSNVNQYGFLSTGHQTFIQGPPASFFKATFESMNTEGTAIRDPLDILRIAEESEVVPSGFTEDICKSDKDELLRKLKSVSQDAMLRFFQEIEEYVPYGFTTYTLDDNGLLCLQKLNTYGNLDIPRLTFLVLEDGLCCPLYESDEILIGAIAEMISQTIQYTPCTNNKDKISIPGFLKNLIEAKVEVWVQNAFLAKRLREGREYVIENDNVRPVDFKSTGIIELNKKWGDGLQQFVEIKHQVQLSTISTVTNYVSNIAFFEKYHGKIYGTTGTLGNETELQFLHDLYPNFTACKIPTFSPRKLFEVQGTLKTSAKEWKSEIQNVVMEEISLNPYRKGRAALVICETINIAQEIHEMLKSIIPGKIILYCRSDMDSFSKINEELLPGDVVVATNLAGRGTDIKVSKQVNENGGLFVILSFLSENTRVELQAFGRTARKGKPGSAQIIMTTDHLHDSFHMVSSVEEAKKIRDRLAAQKIDDMMNDIREMKLREDLFSEYCKTLQEIYSVTDEDEKNAVVAMMNEFWGIWLQTKTQEIDQLKREDLEKSLKDDLSAAKSQSLHQTSPCSSIYHYIKFGNIAMDKRQWDVSSKLFNKAMSQDKSWAAIAFYSHAYCTIKQKKDNYLTEAIEDLLKAQESLKYCSEEYVLCLQFIKMSSADSKNGDPTSLQKQLITKCNMLSYFDQNINEAIKKLEEIKGKERDAIANKSPMFSLVSDADEDLKVEAYNLYRRGLNYVFTVEEAPRFCWEGLLVFFLGVMQIIAGALLTAFTFGTLAQLGMGLITEGISDCIYGIESMVTGEFSWKSWAIEKAISIGISLIGYGVGKLIAKGFKTSKLLVKGFGKQLKAFPKFISSQAKDGLSAVCKTNMKNVVKVTAKTMVQEVISYGLSKAEDVLLNEILEGIKDEVKKDIVINIKTNIEKNPLSSLVDSIILSHIEDRLLLPDLLQDEIQKKKLQDIFRDLTSIALHPFSKDLNWQNKLNSSISTVMDQASAQAKGKTKVVLGLIKTVHMGALSADAIVSVRNLSNDFISNLNEELKKFKSITGCLERVTSKDLSPSDIEMMKKFKQDLADSISTLLADSLVEIFHQKFSSHIVSNVKGKVNGVIGHYVRSGLKTDRTEDKLRAGQHNRYITYFPIDQKSHHKNASNHSKCSRSHAENIKESSTPGTILDIRVLSETFGTKVVILTERQDGKLHKMQEFNPDTKHVSHTVTLIYRPKSAQHPHGHYDVHIDNKTVSITTKDKNCLFHAFAKGMKPGASEEEITLEANRLRSVEAQALRQNPGQWEPFIKRKELAERIRGGDWYIAEGAAPKIYIEETKEVLNEEIGKVVLYKDWLEYKKDNNLGTFINGDHQPPVQSIIASINHNQNSKLAQAMLEVATNSSPLNPKLIDDVKNTHGLELPVVYVPASIHHQFPSSIYATYRDHLAKTISKDDVVATFKVTILGSMPRFMVRDNKGFKNFQDTEVSKSRLAAFQQSFEEHSIRMTKKWFDLLQGKGVMTNNHLDTLTGWIQAKGYQDQNDRFRTDVANLLTSRDERKRKRSFPEIEDSKKQ